MTDADKVKALRAAYDDAEAAYTTVRDAYYATQRAADDAQRDAYFAAAAAWNAYQAAVKAEKDGAE